MDIFILKLLRRQVQGKRKVYVFVIFKLTLINDPFHSDEREQTRQSQATLMTYFFLRYLRHFQVVLKMIPK